MRRVAPEHALLIATLTAAGIGLVTGLVEFAAATREARALQADRAERDRADGQLRAASTRLLAEAARDRALAQRQDDLAAGRAPRSAIELAFGEGLHARATLAPGADGVVVVHAAVLDEAGPGGVMDARARVTKERVEVVPSGP